MPIYEYGRIRQLADKLAEAGVSKDIIDQIMAGGELIGKAAKPEKKADWLSGAMERMDALLDEDTRRIVRESCACCLGGKRLELSKKIAKNHPNLEDAVAAANETKLVFGHSVTLESDGRIYVSFSPEGRDSYRCVCLTRAKAPVSVTYCYCCGGHVKHHLQIALNKKLSCRVESSALASGGKERCRFSFAVEE
jgi:hypothetical protein